MAKEEKPKLKPVDHDKLTCTFYGDYDPDEEGCQEGETPPCECRLECIENSKQQKLQEKENQKTTQEEADILDGNTDIKAKVEESVPECFGNFENANSCKKCPSLDTCTEETNQSSAEVKNQIENAKKDDLPEETVIKGNFTKSETDPTEDELKKAPQVEPEIKHEDTKISIDQFAKVLRVGFQAMAEVIGEEIQKSNALLEKNNSLLEELLDVFSEEDEEAEIETVAKVKTEEDILNDFGNWNNFLMTIKTASLTGQFKECVEGLKTQYNLKPQLSWYLLFRKVGKMFGITVNIDKAYLLEKGIKQ